VQAGDATSAQSEVPEGERTTGGEVARLRAQLERVQRRRLELPVLPTIPALASLLPGGGLRPGAAYSVGPSVSLLLALLARPSQEGSWCGVVGLPELGVEAAEHLGVDLARLVLIPDPGPRWLAVTATIAEVLPVVVVRPRGSAADAEVARLAARLRDRGAVLLVRGAWPQAEAVIDVDEAQWAGVGAGFGYLSRREVTVTVRSRHSAAPRRERLLLPDAAGAAVAAPTPAVPGRVERVTPERVTPERVARVVPERELRAVG